jgi:hypothetical protein
LRRQGKDEQVGETLAPTKLGLAIFRSSFSPGEGLLVHRELRRASECLLLDNVRGRLESALNRLFL